MQRLLAIPLAPQVHALQYQDVFQISLNSTGLSQLVCCQNMLPLSQSFQLSYSGFIFVTFLVQSPFVTQTSVFSHPPISTSPLHLSTISSSSISTHQRTCLTFRFLIFNYYAEFIKMMAFNQTSSPPCCSTRQEASSAAQAQGGKAPLKLAAPAASTLAATTTKARGITQHPINCKSGRATRRAALGQCWCRSLQSPLSHKKDDSRQFEVAP